MCHREEVDDEALDVPVCDWNQERSSRSRSGSSDCLIRPRSGREMSASRATDGVIHAKDTLKERQSVERMGLRYNEKSNKISSHSREMDKADDDFALSSPNTYDTVPP
ncbi:unnamed protein product [Toxocara canis]|uniref:SORBS1 n=1 Tax=Toxocara canis TaxID=6265 RepID=A0A183UGG1_TOXCA|nr:unnamed protein product [Toxocara canis]